MGASHKEAYAYFLPLTVADIAKREFEKWKFEQEKKLAEKAKNEAMPK